MGALSRLRRLAVQAGHLEFRFGGAKDHDVASMKAVIAEATEQSRVEIASLPKEQQTRSQVQGAVEKAVHVVVQKTVGDKIAQMKLAQQAETAMRLLAQSRRMSGFDFRASFMRGFVTIDLPERIAEGKTDDEITAYYMECPQFVAFWKALEEDEESLRARIAAAREG